MNSILNILSTKIGSPEWSENLHTGMEYFVLGITTVFANLAILMLIISVVGMFAKGKPQNDNRQKKA